MTLETLIAVVLAIALLALLGRMLGRDREKYFEAGFDEGWQARDTHGNLQARATECVDRIFSRADEKYIEALKSSRLTGMFRRERKSLAHFWVRQAKRRLQGILKEHVETARHSQELELATEARILWRYAELRLLCGLMAVCIECAGPESLRRAALHVHQVSERLGETQRALAMAERSRTLEGATPR